MHRRTRTIAVAALALSAVTLAACSGSTDDAGGSGGADGSSPSVVDDGGGVQQPPATGSDAGVERVTRSRGCDTGSAPAIGLDEEIGIDADGTPRTYLRHVPPAHDGATEVPVVVDLHGYQEGARIHSTMSGLGPFGDAQGFVTITPQGLGEVPRWTAESGSEDVNFITNVLDDVESTLCVDLDRFYVTGLSNGAFMTSALACDMADRFAAAAPVAGISDIAGCAPERPVPVIAFHGTADTFVAYDGGLGEGAMSLPAPDGSGRTLGDLVAAGEMPEIGGPAVPDITTAWATRNGCEPTPTEKAVGDDVTEVTYTCPAGAEVQLYRIEGGGHTWPGSTFSQSLESIMGRTTTTIDANALMWAFFQAHPMPAS